MSRISKTSDVTPSVAESEDAARTRRAAMLQNPIDAIPMENIAADVDQFISEKGLSDYRHEMHMGGLAAKIENIPGGANNIEAFTDEEREALLYEQANPWKSTPVRLYLLAALCAGCAIVQGMDQTVINGAQVCIVPALLSLTSQDVG